MESYLKQELVILVPVLMAVGQYLKGYISTKKLPLFILLIGVVFAIIFGFLTSIYTGWKLILDAIVMTGLLQGSLAAFISMGVYDLILKPISALNNKE